MVVQRRAAVAGRSEDENDVESLVMSTECFDGGFICRFSAVPGPVVGIYPIKYQVT